MKLKNNIKSTILLALFSFWIFASCSPKVEYDVLSFFFDGVPNPDETGKQKSDTLNQKPEESINIAEQKLSHHTLHQPFEDKTCDACHDIKSSYKLQSKQPELCHMCHESVEKGLKYIHGPAASGYCTECHNPHESEFKKLIITDKQQLCLKCHQASDVFSNEIHSGIGDAKCWDCHNPHGGNDRSFLK